MLAGKGVPIIRVSMVYYSESFAKALWYHMGMEKSQPEDPSVHRAGGQRDLADALDDWDFLVPDGSHPVSG